jgi:hypothetical protein
MRLEKHISLNFNNNMSTAAVHWDIEKAFDTTWHSGILYKWSDLGFSISSIKLIASFLTERKFKVLLEGECYMPIKKKRCRGFSRFLPYPNVMVNILSHVLRL